MEFRVRLRVRVRVRVRDRVPHVLRPEALATHDDVACRGPQPQPDEGAVLGGVRRLAAPG